MIYIVGTEFTIGQSARPAINKTQSIQEMLSQQNRLVKSNYDSKFKSNHTYKLVYIKKNGTEFNYTFEDLHTKDVIIQPFNSTTEADNYIARLSNATQELTHLRNQIDLHASTAI